MYDYDEYCPLKTVLEDIEKIEVDLENIIFQDFKTGKNGVPYVELLIGGDWEVPVTIMLYWDGKKFRGYVPTYGNSFNAKTKAAFGSEESHVGPYCWTEDGVKVTKTFASDDEYCDFMEKNMQYFECNFEACAEDFSERVEGTPTPTFAALDRQLIRSEKPKKKVCKKGTGHGTMFRGLCLCT